MFTGGYLSIFLKEWMRRLEARFAPNVTSFNALVSGYAQRQDTEGALRAFEDMVRRGLQPNSVSYKVLPWHLAPET